MQSTGYRLPSTGIQIVNPLEIPDWDEQIAAFPSATIFHTAAWARVLVDTYGFKPCYFALCDSETVAKPGKAPSDLSAESLAKAEALPRFATGSDVPSLCRSVVPSITAILPMMEVDSWLTGRRGVGLPFSDDCPPLAVSAEAVTKLFDAAAEYGRSRNWRSVEVRGGQDSFPSAPASIAYLGHSIALVAEESVLNRQLDPSARRAVRKAEQAGLTIEMSRTGEALATYYKLHCATRRRQGLPPQSWSFFENIQKHVLARGHGRVLIAGNREGPVAGAVFFQFGRHALYKFGASDPSHLHLRGNDLIFWHAIRAFAKEGFKVLDLGRTSLANEGLKQFKRKWGAIERQLNYLKFQPGNREWLVAKDRASGWYNRLFRILPTPLSQFIGGLLYPHTA